MGFTRQEIQDPETYIKFILRDYPRYETEANASLLLSRSKLTKEGLRASPVSSRERADEVIQECIASGRLGVNPEWLAPLQQWLSQYPQYKVVANYDLLEKLCREERLPWSADSFAYLAGQPDNGLSVTVEYQRQQDQLKAFEANAKRDADKADEYRNLIFDQWMKINAPHYRSNPFGFRLAQGTECNRLNGLSTAQVFELWEKKAWARNIRSTETTPEEKQRNKELVGRNVNLAGQYMQMGDSTWIFGKKIPLDAESVRNYMHDRDLLKLLMQRFGGEQIDRRRFES